MKTVYLTSGPRGSGKSTYIKELVSRHPEVSLISRDEILIRLFGSTSLESYGGGHFAAMEVLFKEVGKCLSSGEKADLVLDCWNGFPEDRKDMIGRLRNLGADRVVCWQFITTIDMCIKWFLQKGDVRGYSERGARHDYRLYHRLAKDIQEDGFDGVCLVDPCQLVLPSPFPFPVLWTRNGNKPGAQ